MELRIVIAAGGTGGHLFPGLAVAREFQVRHGAAVTFLTSPKPVTTRILAGYGFMMEYDMQRYWRDSKLFEFAPITNEMVRNFLAERLGLPRSY